MSVGDASVRTDDEGFGNAINAPVNADPPFEISAGARIGITQRVQPLGRVLRRVLVVDAVERNDALPADLQEKRVLEAAGNAPRGEEVHQRHLPLEVAARQAERSALDWPKAEFRNFSANEV